MAKKIDLDGLEYFKSQENGMIATVEDSSTASKDYAVGERFYLNGKLCIATVSIDSGDTLTLNTNCILDVLGDDVTEIKKTADTALDMAEGGFEQKTITNVPIASFADGADNIPVKSLVVVVEPVQDLHGQNAPYPAGGGKNKLPSTKYQYSETIVRIGTDDTAGEIYHIPLKSGVTYTLSVVASVNVSTYGKYYKDGSYSSEISLGTNGGTFTAPETADYLFWCYKSGSLSVDDITKFQLEEGSSATSWSPYSNLCHITGFTRANVYRTGVNVWDEDARTGYFNENGEWVNNGNFLSSNKPIPVKPSTTYYLYCGSATGGSNKINISYWNAPVPSGASNSANFLGRSEGLCYQTFTTPAGCTYIHFGTGSWYGGTYKNDISINYPSTDTSYHAYSGITIPVAFPNEAGTVYGGEVDVTGGKLRVKKLYYEVDGTNNYFELSGDYANIRPNGVVSGIDSTVSKWICNTFSSNTYNFAYNSNIGFVYLNKGAWQKIGSTSAELNAYASQHPIQFVLPLATSIEYDLTDIPTITTLLGVNNIWASTGNIKELVYRAMNNVDAKITLVKALLAKVEVSTTATQAYSANDFLIIGDTLYIVTADIADGGTILPNTNVTATTIGAQLTAILNA